MSTPSGLSDSEVLENRRLYGSNVITPPKRRHWFWQLLDKFKDSLIIILLVAGFLSVLISVYEYYSLGMGVQVFFEPVGIFAAVLLATGLSFYFEIKAAREFDILNKVNDDEPVQVIRDGGRTMVVARRDVVVGDIVSISAGDEIPADGRIISAVSLSVDESSLTGEPICHKTDDHAHLDPDATFPSDFLLRGTKVMEGHALMEVTAVGDATENGKVFTASTIDTHVKTPLAAQLDRLGSLIARASYVIAAAVVIGRVIVYFSATSSPDLISFLTFMLQTAMIVVALIAVAVPEGLPMAVNLSLAYSMRRMLKTNNLVRRLHACETMGATTVICTDKTGTLTANKMQVVDTMLVGNPAAGIIDRAIAVNSTANLDTTAATPAVIGNPTEGALLLWLDSRGTDYRTIRSAARVVDELPFSTERKYMATVTTDADGSRTIYVKGAPEIVMALCDVDPGVAADVTRKLAAWQASAMRTLALASLTVPAGDSTPLIADGRVVARGLTLLAVVAIADPVRPDVPDAVSAVRRAGIGIKIVTGDTPATAREIARRIGLWVDGTDTDSAIALGTDIEAMTHDELVDRAPALKIIARARPMDKKRLVEALRDAGEIVAVTGDGTNDAPALKAAHVGLSMGDGTSVAKEASDITIIDNSFSSIARAVMWGRSLYRNIQRFILFQLTVNVVACLIVLVGAFMGTQSPLTVTQMLWVNLIMDTFAAVALASLPPDPSVMNDKPRRPDESIISRPMRRDILATGLAFFAVLFALLYILEHTVCTSLTRLFDSSWIAANKGLSPFELSVFFTVFVFMQFWNMFNARAFMTGRSALHLEGCRGFIFIALLILVGQILIVTVGGPLFSVVPLPVIDWLIIIGATSLVLWIGEAIRACMPAHGSRRA